MRKIFVLFLIYTSINCFVYGETNKLETLDSISQILLSNIDQNQKLCGLNSQKSKDALNALHALIDEVSKDYINPIDYQKIQAWTENCSNGCHCYFYMGLLEKNLRESKTRVLYDKIKLSARRTTTNQKKACLKQAKKLCSSKEMKAVIKDSKNFSPAPGV